MKKLLFLSSLIIISTRIIFNWGRVEKRLLLILLSFCGFQNIYASHLRFGTMEWQRADMSNPEEVTFVITLYTRMSFNYSPNGPNPGPGSVVTASGSSLPYNLYTGDGSVVNIPSYTVLQTNPGEDMIVIQAIVAHNYPTASAIYQAYTTRCCRLSNLLFGQADDNFRLEATVPPPPSWRSPAYGDFGNLYFEENLLRATYIPEMVSYAPGNLTVTVANLTNSGTSTDLIPGLEITPDSISINTCLTGAGKFMIPMRATDSDGAMSSFDILFDILNFDLPNDFLGLVDSDLLNPLNYRNNSFPPVGSDPSVADIRVESGIDCSGNIQNQPVVESDYLLNRSIEMGSETSLTVRPGVKFTCQSFRNPIVSSRLILEADETGIASFITVEQSLVQSLRVEQHLTESVFNYVTTPAAGVTASDYGVGNGNEMWSADETTQTYNAITDANTMLDPGKGYIVRPLTSGTVTLDGIYIGNASIGLTRTGITAPNRGYNLVGNPFLSSLDWDGVISSADTSNLFGTIWIRTRSNSDVMLYDTYNPFSNIGTSNNYFNTPVTGIIPPGQAFWTRLKNDDTSMTLSFPSSARVHGSQTSLYRMEAEEGTIRMSLSNGTLSDETIVLFNAVAEDGYDDYDSHKFWAAASVPQLYTTTGTDSLVINGLESVATNPIVDLGVKLPSTGNYSFTATDITLANEVWLEDRLLNIFQDLNLDATYDFTDEAGNIPTRFALHFGMSITDIRNTDAFSAQVFSSGNEVNIILSDATNGTAAVYDMAGKRIATQNIHSDRTAFQVNVASGIYIVKLESNKGTSTHKIHLD